MGNHWLKGNLHGFPRRHVYVQGLIQRNGILGRFPTAANIPPVAILDENMAAVCQKNRDHSRFTGIIPFDSEIIGFPGGQNSADSELAVASATTGDTAA